MRLIIFDVDGTLVDSQAEIAAAMEAAFARHGWPLPSRAAVLSVVGLSLPDAIAALAPEASPDALDQAVSEYKAFYAAARQAHGADKAPLFPGAAAALQRLSARDDCLLGVATGKSKRGLDALLDAHDLRHFFVTMQTADGHPSKPHPAMVETCLAETGIEAANAVMVGDTSYDMQMAKAAQIATIGVSWGYHPVTRLQGDADAILSSFAELDAAIDAVLGRALP